MVLAKAIRRGYVMLKMGNISISRANCVFVGGSSVTFLKAKQLDVRANHSGLWKRLLSPESLAVMIA